MTLVVIVVILVAVLFALMWFDRKVALSDIRKESGKVVQEVEDIASKADISLKLKLKDSVSRLKKFL